ncbi:MAG TPA: ABC transporter permease [Vicinamibacteria bacterium]|nr:ABC transporter permease [Vicinamibacteria bacterium]
MSKAALASAVVVAGIALLALLAPAIAPYDPLEQDLANNYAGPSREHLLGTDDLGRDIWSRLLYGGRVSLGIAFTSVGFALVAGTLVGLLSAYYGGWVDSSLMRLMDVLLALPGILLGIAVVVVLGSGIGNTVIAVAVMSTPTFARLARASALTILARDHVAASRAVGASAPRILLGQVLPNALTPLVVASTLQLGTAVLIASGLSFLGLGVAPPHPEWGAMLSKGRELVRATPVAAFAPGFFLTVLVLSFSLLGDGLRDALDPKHRRSGRARPKRIASELLSGTGGKS